MKLCESCRDAFVGEPSHCPECGGDLSGGQKRSGVDLAGIVVGDKYELVELFGEGGMGWIYRAVHRELGRVVAVKLLKSGIGDNEDRMMRFEREARAASRLNHPHILSVIDFGRTKGGLLYLVSEFLDGTNLFELSRGEESMPLYRAVNIFHQVLAGVEEAHMGGVIHRDLKPENIIVIPLRSGEDFVKILDFGIAALTDREAVKITQEGVFLGTPGYMAPEVIDGASSSERSDIYALGCILYEILTGVDLFDADNLVDMLESHRCKSPPLLADTAPQLGNLEALDRIIQRALAKKPEARYGSVAQMRAEIVEALAKIGKVQLQCDRCTRPVDPATGLCALHRAPGDRTSAPPQTVAFDDRKTPVTNLDSHRRESLIATILDNRLMDRENDAEEMVDFLLGSSSLLEIVGAAGIGKTALLAGMGRAAHDLGLAVLEARPESSPGVSALVSGSGVGGGDPRMWTRACRGGSSGEAGGGVGIGGQGSDWSVAPLRF